MISPDEKFNINFQNPAKMKKKIEKNIFQKTLMVVWGMMVRGLFFFIQKSVFFRKKERRSKGFKNDFFAIWKFFKNVKKIKRKKTRIFFMIDIFQFFVGLRRVSTMDPLFFGVLGGGVCFHEKIRRIY